MLGGLRHQNCRGWCGYRYQGIKTAGFVNHERCLQVFNIHSVMFQHGCKNYAAQGCVREQRVPHGRVLAVSPCRLFGATNSNVLFLGNSAFGSISNLGTFIDGVGLKVVVSQGSRCFQMRVLQGCYPATWALASCGGNLATVWSILVISSLHPLLSVISSSARNIGSANSYIDTLTPHISCTMALGILEPKTNVHVPGTILLNEQAAHSESQTQALKHGRGKNSSIILAPQPSEDPNDPLNWSTFQKHLVLGILCLGSIVNAAVQVSIHCDISEKGIELTLEGSLTRCGCGANRP